MPRKGWREAGSPSFIALILKDNGESGGVRDL